MWKASQAWFTSAFIVKPDYFPYFGGSVGFAIPRTDISGLKQFLYDRHLGTDPGDVLTIEFWHTAFNCSWPNSNSPYNSHPRVNMIGKEDRLHALSDRFCTGEEKLEDLKNTYLHGFQLRITNNVKQAVYSMAYAMDHLRGIQGHHEEAYGLYIPGSTYAYIPDFEPWQLMYCTKTLKFTTHNGVRIEIDKNEDLAE
ncbi:Vomeronasal type-2 receptor 1 [Galemys pyrenaicus]|uniref:Vomeronasal type-2 receptor 1 n=1 Tax=Galemys pyrenaicus TaxID=202257 RepID=A0A8J6DK64_GALPY|nr:Vomeronasal type-2 receptor 1 [Galemys pyrenaicus]